MPNTAINRLAYMTPEELAMTGKRALISETEQHHNRNRCHDAEWKNNRGVCQHPAHDSAIESAY